MSVVLLMYGLLIVQSAVFGAASTELIKLQNVSDSILIKLRSVGGYSIENFNSEPVLTKMYEDNGLATKNKKLNRAAFDIRGGIFKKFSGQQTRDPLFVNANDSKKAMAILTAPNGRRWIAVSLSPWHKPIFDGKDIKDGAAVNYLELGENNFMVTNNFAIVDVDWEELKKMKEKGKKRPVPLKVIWDPMSGKRNEDFQKDLCGWLTTMHPKGDFSLVCNPKTSSEPAAPAPTKTPPVSKPKPTHTTPPKVMPAAKARELVNNLTKLAADLAALSNTIS